MKLAKTRILSILIALLLAAGACKGDSKGDSDESSAPANEEDEAAEPQSDEAAAHTYTVRGRVEVVPGEDQEKIQIHHEEVPDFVNQKGEVSNMASMSMPFGVADDLSLEGIEEGDLIEFTFEVDWDHPDVSRVTAIEKLPEDTELELE